jgi:16S rRNA (guanine527-N7)-methyltransferase
LVLAMLLPDVRVTLVEPMARRVAFLGECVTGLGLTNVTVCRARAEEIHGRLTADVVTARAVAPLGRLAGLAVPLLRPGGVILALKGERADAEAEAAGPELRRLGVSEVSVLRAGTGLVSPAATVVRLTADGSVRQAPRAGPAARARASGHKAPGRGRRQSGRGGSSARV